MTEKEAIEELLYQEDMRGEGLDYQVNNLVIAKAVKALEEIQQYRAIGTVEECREAMDRQIPRKPKREVWDKDLKLGNVTFKAGTKVYLCPSCEKGISGADGHCRCCGQAIDWSE